MNDFRCKNFFKRSVLVCQDRPYVYKFDGQCSVSVTEIDGVKQKGPRCQACRYQACLDAGMYHSGVQRSRGGRHVSSALPAATTTSQPNRRSNIINNNGVDHRHHVEEKLPWQKSHFSEFLARLKAGNGDAATV